MKKLLVKTIDLYQHTLSPDHGWFSSSHPGGYCRFQPTCSQYAKEAIEEYGAAAGLFLATARVMRCHPWGAKGADPLPNK